MAVLKWDQPSEKFYETGVDQCVLYLQDPDGEYSSGYAWSGITAVNENPSGGDATDLWADNTKYLSLRAAEEFGGTIEAYMYPDQFAQCDGSAAMKYVSGSASLDTGIMVGQQTRKTFGLCYRTKIGNDVDYDDKGYKLHIIYGCTCSPSGKDYSTINDSPEAITFSWEFTTVPVPVTGFKPTSYVVVDSLKVNDETKMKALEDALYGTANASPYLPLPDDIKSLMYPGSNPVNPAG